MLSFSKLSVAIVSSALLSLSAKAAPTNQTLSARYIGPRVTFFVSQTSVRRPLRISPSEILTRHFLFLESNDSIKGGTLVHVKKPTVMTIWWWLSQPSSTTTESTADRKLKVGTKSTIFKNSHFLTEARHLVDKPTTFLLGPPHSSPVQVNGKSVVAVASDECPPCAMDHSDLSVGAIRQLDDNYEQFGLLKGMTYEFV